MNRRIKTYWLLFKKFKNLALLLQILLLYFLCSGLAVSAQSKKAKVVFISVATDTEKYWGDIHALAKAAAVDLGVDLEILLSNRDHLKARELAKEVSKRKNKPDYAIVVSEKLIASRSIPILAENGIKVIMFGSLSNEEKELIGEPREKYTNYIGKIAVDDYMAGYLSAELMIKEAIKNKLHDEKGQLNFLSLEGETITAFNFNRVRGLRDLLKKYPMANIIQSVHTDWTYEEALQITPMLLKRYSDVKIAGVWCANSALSEGASAILKSHGKRPGVDFVTVGTDWSTAGVKSVSNGDVAGISGGHVAAAAWIITLLHDYHNGIDFDESVYLNKVTLMDEAISNKFLKIFGDGHWDIIDFSKYSKAANAKLKQYDLSFRAILNDL